MFGCSSFCFVPAAVRSLFVICCFLFDQLLPAGAVFHIFLERLLSKMSAAGVVYCVPARLAFVSATRV